MRFGSDCRPKIIEEIWTYTESKPLLTISSLFSLSNHSFSFHFASEHITTPHWSFLYPPSFGCSGFPSLCSDVTFHPWRHTDSSMADMLVSNAHRSTYQFKTRSFPTVTVAERKEERDGDGGWMRALSWPHTNYYWLHFFPVLPLLGRPADASSLPALCSCSLLSYSLFFSLRGVALVSLHCQMC